MRRNGNVDVYIKNESPDTVLGSNTRQHNVLGTSKGAFGLPNDVQVKDKRATILTVAEHAGVSVATVSRVLNNSDKCSPQTRRRVHEAVAQLGYVPSHVGRSLKRLVTEEIALGIPDIGNPVYVAMAKAVQLAAKQCGYRLSLISTDGLANEEMYAIRNLAEHRVDGLIICSLRVDERFIREVEMSRGPIVVIGRMPESAKVDNVRVDSEAGAALAVQHLIDQGCRRIAFINGIANTVPAVARLKGYRRALFDNNLALDSRLVVNADFSLSGGYEAMDGLLEHKVSTDAVFCANDVMALGALRRLREAGINVPEDIAIVGMDNIDEGLVTTPTLTSVSLLAGERGRIATELLLDRITNKYADEPRKVTVMPRLIVRESSMGYVSHANEGITNA